MAVVVGVMTFSASVARYSGSWAFLFAFVLIVDTAHRRLDADAGDRGLTRLVERAPRLMLLAGFVLSLAGWMRTEYAVFGLIWAAILLAAGRRSAVVRRCAAATAGFALLPSIVVVAAGGFQGLWWWVTYTLSRGPSGFDAQRGQDVDWSLFADRLRELAHLHLESGDPGAVVASYGLAAVIVGVAAILALLPRGRRWLLRDATALTPFLLIVAAVVLFGQSARFSSAYGILGLPVFLVAGALLVGRPPLVAIVGFTVAIAWPVVVPGLLPTTTLDQWSNRPQWRDREAIKGFNYLPVRTDDGSTEMLAALPKVWHQLGLDGRPTLSVGLHNDLAWGNDTYVGYLLDAPAAGWPLTYDPGLANADKVQRRVVAQLCSSHAPVVQLDGDYPYPPDVDPGRGSRRLDAFLALNHRLSGVAGHYRILTPRAATCLRPDDAPSALVARRRDSLFVAGETAPAGALASLLMDRAKAVGHPVEPKDALIAAAGGYRPRPGDLPPGDLRRAAEALWGGASSDGLLLLAARRWSDDVVGAIVQSAWVTHGRRPGAPAERVAAQRVRQLALRHPRWPMAITNAAAVVPAGAQFVAALGRRGAGGVPAFDRWRFGAAAARGDAAGMLEAGQQLADDLAARHDPVGPGTVELKLAQSRGLTPACAALLRRRADARAGVHAPTPPVTELCDDARIRRPAQPLSQGR